VNTNSLRVFLLPREVDSCFSEESCRAQDELHKQAYEPEFWSIRQRKATLLSNQAWQAKRSRIMKQLTRQCEEQHRTKNLIERFETDKR
jgi:hypothetical protein